MAMFNKSAWKEDNDWTTPKYVWDEVMEYIPRDKEIWLPFYNEGASGHYLKEKGFNIVHKDENFWEVDYGDVVIDNPPYRITGIPLTKEKIIMRLMDLNKPFMLLVPTTTLQTKYFKNLDDGNFQVIMPSTKYNFEKDGKIHKATPFYTLWICWKMNLKKDFIIL